MPTLFVAGTFAFSTSAATTLLALTLSVLDDHHFRGDIGFILATRTIAGFAALLAAGRFIHPNSARRGLMTLGVSSAALQSGFAVLFLSSSDSYWLLLTLCVGLGCMDGMQIPCESGFVRGLVDDNRLIKLNAALTTARSTSKVLGASVVGLLLAFMGPPWLFFVSAAGCLLHAISVFFTRGRTTESVRNPQPDKNSGSSGPSAWREFFGSGWMVALSAQATILTLIAWSPYLVIGPQLSEKWYGGPTAWAVINGAYGAGAVVAGVASTLRPPTRLMPGILIAFPLWCAPLAAFALGASMLVVLVAAVAAGIGSSLFNVCWATMIQRHVSKDNFSQIVSWVTLGPMLVSPLGMVIAGLLSSEASQVLLLGIGAVVPTGGVLILLLFPGLRSLHRLKAETQCLP